MKNRVKYVKIGFIKYTYSKLNNNASITLLFVNVIQNALQYLQDFSI